MEKISISEWLDDEMISMLFSDDEIKRIKSDYKFSKRNGKYIDEEELPEIMIDSGFPLVDSYFDDITIFNEYFDEDIETEKEYIYRYAECKLKCHILCACQIWFGFPLWQDHELPKWEKKIKEELEEIYQEMKNKDSFVFHGFFPHFSNEYVRYPLFMLQWIYEVINEFFDLADTNMYHLTAEEAKKEREENKRIIEEIFSKKR